MHSASTVGTAQIAFQIVVRCRMLRRILSAGMEEMSSIRESWAETMVGT